MATLADRRRAIGERNLKARRGLGEANEKARRALGDEMIKRRTGRDEVDDINAVVRQPRQRAALPPVAARGGVPAQVGTGNYTAPPPVTGGGIASPLTEKTRIESGVAVPDRTYWPATYFATSDGLLLFEFRPTQTWRLTDADGGDVEINVARPRSATLP